MTLPRRDFLKIIGGATVATALPGCVPQKPQSLIPYIIPHEEIVPGTAVWYASICRECPAGCGIHVRVREGRAVKIEGNPVHPINRGALCARGQASLHGLYNPDRIQHPLRKRSDGSWEQMTWEAALEFLVSELQNLVRERKGAGIAWLTPHMTGSLDALIGEFLTSVGSRRRVRYEPFGNEALKAANRITFGTEDIPSYDFTSAKVIVSFGADFLETWQSPVEQTRGFTETRQFDGTSVHPFVYVGPRLSLTATNADEWIAPVPGTEHLVALAVLQTILSAEGTVIPRREAQELLASVMDFTPSRVAETSGVSEERIRVIARLLMSHSPGLVVGGGPAIGGETEIQTLIAVNLINYALGNIGKTVLFDKPRTISVLDSYADLFALVRSMEQGQITALLFTESNPVFSAPSGLNLSHALTKVPLTVAFSSFMDETTAQAGLVLPIHTPLESWGDYEAVRGEIGLMQPVMQPVFPMTRMLGDVLVELKERITGRGSLSRAEQPFLEYVRNRWRSVHRQTRSNEDFDVWWTGLLANGGLFAAFPPAGAPVRLRTRSYRFSTPQRPQAELTLVTYPSIALYDGRGANRPWLQELPDPMTQITWENWIELSTTDAETLGVRRGDIVEVISDHGSIELPAYVYPGIRPGVAAVPIGQGHTEYGRYAKGNGANIAGILPPLPVASSGSTNWSGVAVRIVRKHKSVPLADVAGSDYLHGRNIVQMVTVEELLKQTRELAEGAKQEVRFGEPGSPTLYPEHEHPNYRWGMTIDLDKCTGCSACVTACYAENNVPVVGKHQVELGRELSWIRIERYFDDPPADPSLPYKPNAEFLPMLCQQCDNAPCEPVCPVYASYHTPEGLNAQVYNRCVGTRYCANNCPYKVRRFNWFDYEFPEPLNWQLNPDVTVRSKGVMEKCTFCVQRIVGARNAAGAEGRAVADGEITTACQQACPAQAIVFGDLKDPKSRVNVLRETHRARGYRVLEELNTQPAVVYLKEIRSG